MAAFLLDTSVFSQWTATIKWPDLAARVDGIFAVEGKLCLPFVAHYEILRGLHDLLQKGQGAERHARYMFLVDSALVFVGLDARGGLGWAVAAELHAKARAVGITLSEGDLLIAASALVSQRKLLTCDVRLAKNLDALGLGENVEVLALR